MYVIIISTLLGATLGFGFSYVSLIAPLKRGLDDLQAEIDQVNLRLVQVLTLSNKTVHTVTLHWDLQPIQSNSRVEGYVKNWTVPEAISILQIDVWMGNPYNLTWEGDVFVTLNTSIDPWNPPIDTVLVHYQFDSHASSPIPHQLSFDLRPGFPIDFGTTLHVYRLFNNFDEKDTEAGDGWVRLYYTTE